MGPLTKSLLLFAMNWLDAQLTLVWIRLNVASEGNGLMARVLDHGEASFLGLKLAVGAFAAYVLYRCAHIPLARRGMTLVLLIYVALMFVHTATGYHALGCRGPMAVLGYFGAIPSAFLGLLS
ncbi:MAG TPA: DUF5658 family protein [Pyrinomonadaceae bacterium]|nr:DUF5658 family protein [Pyrinomonadaceae bacterium]